MRMICPYCGTKQDGKNTKCQFCGAAMPPEQSAPEAEATATTALCEICMNSFPTGELSAYEGRRVCTECLRKLKRQEAALTPSIKKPAVAAAAGAEEAPARPGRRFAIVFVLGAILIAGGAIGGYVGYGHVCAARARALRTARRKLAPVLERCNQALAILVQEAPDERLLAEAILLLQEALKELNADDLGADTSGFPALERFRVRVEKLERQRLRCARALAGSRLEGSPASAGEAKEALAKSRDEAVLILSDLVRGLRLYGLSIEGLVVY